MNSETWRHAVQDVETLAEALILATPQETAIETTREHLWAITEYYESRAEAMRQTIAEQHDVIREVARR